MNDLFVLVQGIMLGFTVAHVVRIVPSLFVKLAVIWMTFLPPILAISTRFFFGFGDVSLFFTYWSVLLSLILIEPLIRHAIAMRHQ